MPTGLREASNLLKLAQPSHGAKGWRLFGKAIEGQVPQSPAASHTTRATFIRRYFPNNHVQISCLQTRRAQTTVWPAHSTRPFLTRRVCRLPMFLGRTFFLAESLTSGHCQK
jgi:hypothetical protein